MDEITPPPIQQAPAIDRTIWKIVLAPLAPLLLAALIAKASSNAAGVFLVIAGLGMLITSIWAAVLLSQKIGKTPVAKVGWGVLFFCVLQLFYIGVSVVGCAAALAAQ